MKKNSFSLISIVFFVLPFLLNPHCFAGRWDASGNASVSLPLGGGVHLWGGYNWLLWGNADNGNYFYGYLRPHARVYFSGIAYRGDARVALFPVSFAGVTTGVGYLRRSTNPAQSEFDCGSFYCQNASLRTYVEPKFNWRLGPVVGSVLGRWERIDSQKSGPFVDPVFLLESPAPQQDALIVGATVALDYIEDYLVGLNYNYVIFTDADHVRNDLGVFARWKRLEGETFSHTLRLGVMSRPTLDSQFSISYRLDWLWLKGLEL